MVTGTQRVTPAGSRSGSIRSRSRALRNSTLNWRNWLNMDQARVVPGARRGFQAVAGTLVGKDDSVIVSALAHYTEFLAVENAGGIIREVPLNAKNIVNC